MKRYSAKLLFQFRVLHPDGVGPMRTCDERIITFEARGDREALRKAKARGKAAQLDYKNDEEIHVFFDFVGVRDMIYLDPSEPEEVWYEIKTYRTPLERREKLIPTDEKLLKQDVIMVDFKNLSSADPFDCLVIAAHPDDGELGVGGTLALLARRGKRVGILHLTRGEAGTRGTPAERAEEAKAAGAVLGLAHVEMLDLGDCDLANTQEHRVTLVEAIRRLRPGVVITNGPDDRHPDHRRAQEVARDSVFLANVGGFHPEAGPRWLTGAVCFFPQHQHFGDPRVDWIVDVGETYEIKLAALRAYKSQLHVGPNPLDADPAKKTYISSPEFWEYIENRSRFWGHRIGATHGEPLLFDRPAHAGHPLVRLLHDLRKP